MCTVVDASGKLPGWIYSGICRVAKPFCAGAVMGVFHADSRRGRRPPKHEDCLEALGVRLAWRAARGGGARTIPMKTALTPVMMFFQLAEGFVTLSQSRFGAQLEDMQALQHGNYTGPPQAVTGFLWSYPATTADNRGLGGGITWAWDPNLCPSILSLFHEDIMFYDLVACHDLKAAMHRAVRNNTVS